MYLLTNRLPTTSLPILEVCGINYFKSVEVGSLIHSFACLLRVSDAPKSTEYRNLMVFLSEDLLKGVSWYMKFCILQQSITL
jgi:hypothetical protein